MDAYGTRHALLVGPNSGYGLDNRLHARHDRARCGTLQGHRRGRKRRDLGRAAGAQARGCRRRGVERHALRRRLLPRRGAACCKSSSRSTCSSISRSSTTSSCRCCRCSPIPAFASWSTTAAAHGRGRPRPAGLSGAARARRNEARLRQALRAREVLAQARAARRCMALRHGAGRRFHARPLPVGVGLALPSRAGARRLRRAACSSRSRFFPTRPTGARFCGTHRASCWASRSESRRRTKEQGSSLGP